MNKILILLMGILILAGCEKANNNVTYHSATDSLVAIDKITYEDTLVKLQEGALLIDVRSLDEYNDGHISKALSLPQENITEDTAKDIIPTKDTVVILYCKSGKRSYQAGVKLKNLGYTNIYDFGTMDNWK